jgi:MoxR-like ATPase
MAGAESLERKLRATVATIGERYFVDPTTVTVGTTQVDHWKVLLGTFTYLADDNALLVGEPGTGKTTFANVVAAAVTGLPADLFARTQIQGHPDQTKEEMLARAHVGKLTTEGVETVVWQNTLFLPQILIDEFNRLPAGKQSIVQEVVRTGSVSHLNEVLDRQDVPFVATINETDQGVYDVTPPILDRFDVSIEFTHGEGWLQPHVERAAARIERDLVDPAATSEILQRLQDPDLDPEDRLAYVDERRDERRSALESHGLAPFAPADERAFREAADGIELTGDAETFLEFLYDEINLSSTRTHKRRSDDPTARTHSQGLAYAKVNNGMSARRRRAIVEYARMLALYLGDANVTRDHVRAVAPHCLAHALDFTDEYVAEREQDRREFGERREEHLARALLSSVEDHYDELSETVKAANSVLRGDSLTDGQRGRVEDLLSGPDPDHPHLQIWAEKVAEPFARRYGGE